jgi:uncharacterized protein YjbI with pentapeptide repeats
MTDTTGGEGLDWPFSDLASATPAERTKLVLRLLQERRPVELPAQEGRVAVLDGIDLALAALREHISAIPSPSWWDAGRQAVDLSHADLRGASFRGANLSGVILEGANLAGSDLAGANLRGGLLDGANLEGAFLEDSDLSGAHLRYARLDRAALEGARLAEADLWGAGLIEADLSGTDLHSANLTEANLNQAVAEGANLQGVILSGADMRGTRLQGADLQGANLKGANLDGAFLRDARLQAAVLSDCSIVGTHFADAWLDRTRLLAGQLGGAIGEELSGEYELARRGYLALERNFEQIGETDASSWAYRKKRRMQKRELGRQARAERKQGNWFTAGLLHIRYLGHQLSEWSCDYGESIPRVLLTMLLVAIVFAAFYGGTGGVLRNGMTTRKPADLALYSLTAMISPGNAPEGMTADDDGTRLVTGLQSFLGIFLIGLLGFVAGNRIRR